MEQEPSAADLLNAWRDGDEAAAARFFERYRARLIAIVRARISRRLARRVEPDDIVLSAYRSFFVTARKGRFEDPSEDLWPLLVNITLRKLARQARRHQAKRRDINQEEDYGSRFGADLVQEEPTVEQAVILEEEVARLLARLSEHDREIVTRTLQGEDAETIANALGIHERSVRRTLQRIRESLGAPERDKISFAATALPAFEKPHDVEPMPVPNVTYSDFLLQQFLGAGAFSKVFRALDQRTNDTVAVKFLRKSCWRDARAVAAMVREYELLSQLDHPRIASVHGWGRTRAGGLFLALELIEGEPLSRRAGETISVQEVIETGIQIADALMAAHSHGILHCDLTPNNVLVEPNGRVVLCDFGLARYATDPDEIPRGGTAGFMAPEQLCDAFGEISARTDVYGLGGLLYFLLTGSAPMRGRDLPETMANVLSAQEPELVIDLGENHGQRLSEIIMHCLRKDRDERFPTACRVRDALVEIGCGSRPVAGDDCGEVSMD